MEIATVIDPTERVARGFCKSRDGNTIVKHWNKTACVAIGGCGASRVREAGVENPCDRRYANFADIGELTILSSVQSFRFETIEKGINFQAPNVLNQLRHMES